MILLFNAEPLATTVSDHLIHRHNTLATCMYYSPLDCAGLVPEPYKNDWSFGQLLLRPRSYHVRRRNSVALRPGRLPTSAAVFTHIHDARALHAYTQNKVTVLEALHTHVRGGDSSVVRAPDSWLKGRGFESLLERRENFLPHGRLSVLALISVSVPPPCYCSST